MRIAFDIIKANPQLQTDNNPLVDKMLLVFGEYIESELEPLKELINLEEITNPNAHIYCKILDGGVIVNFGYSAQLGANITVITDNIDFYQFRYLLDNYRESLGN